MKQDERAALAAAVNCLVEDADARQLHQQMLGVLELARKGMPVALTGRPAVLNPLIQLAIDDEEAYDRVLQLIERKRGERGLSILAPEQDRQAYMREFMAAKRHRQARLVEAWNSMLATDEQLRGQPRLEFERLHAARWIDEKTAREEYMREKLGRRLTNDERKGISLQLWADVDTELAALEQFARDNMRTRKRNAKDFKFLLGVSKKAKQ